MRRARSHGAGTWSPPGGYLEYGERPEDCAVREAKEETGIDVLEVRFLGITNDVFVEGKHHVTLWFEAVRHAGDAGLTAPDEATEVAWFPWDAIPEPRFLPFQHLLEGQFLGRSPDVAAGRASLP